MPTYEYECKKCGYKFEIEQSITEPPLETCPKCGGKPYRLISGGSGFIIKRSSRRIGQSGCSFEQSHKTCCGREEPCSKPPCGD